MGWRESTATDWRKLRRLPGVERWLLFQAIILIFAVSLAQRWTSVRRLHAVLLRLSKTGRSATSVRRQSFAADDVARLVRIAAHRGIPGSTCLPQALVLWTLLRRHGFDAAIHFGVRKNAGALEAHAWVEIEGRVLNDTDDVGERFSRFPRPAFPEEAEMS